MVRSRWIGPLLGILACTGLAWGQAASSSPRTVPPEQIITVEDPGKPPQQYQILRSWKTVDGSTSFLAKSLKTGETTILSNRPNGKSGTKIIMPPGAAAGPKAPPAAPAAPVEYRSLVPVPAPVVQYQPAPVIKAPEQPAPAVIMPAAAPAPVAPAVVVPVVQTAAAPPAPRPSRRPGPLPSSKPLGRRGPRRRRNLSLRHPRRCSSLRLPKPCRCQRRRLPVSSSRHPRPPRHLRLSRCWPRRRWPLPRQRNWLRCRAPCPCRSQAHRHLRSRSQFRPSFPCRPRCRRKWPRCRASCPCRRQACRRLR